jgi:putative spermidine/putrescine transport system substrate-binding protein
MRTSFAIAAVNAIFVLGLAAHSSSVRAEEELVMATWGGATGEIFKKNWGDPFEKATGIKVRMIYGSSSSNKQQVAAQKDKPQIDVLTMVSGDALAAYESGLTEALDPKEIPNLDAAVDVAKRHAPDGKIYAAPLYFTVLGVIYRTDKMGAPMTSWADLWSPKLKDKLAIPNPKFANAHFLVMMNKLAGGQLSDITPGIEKTKTLKGNAILEFEAIPPLMTKIMQGEVWAAPVLDVSAARALKAHDAPAKFYVPKEGAPASVDVIALVKNAPHTAAAKKFIDFVLSKDAAGGACNDLVTTCVRADWIPADKIKDNVLTREEIGRLIAVDDEIVNRDKGKWLEAWIREVTPITSR